MRDFYCVSEDHNESDGCSNPRCWKYNGPVNWAMYGWGLFHYLTNRSFNHWMRVT